MSIIDASDPVADPPSSSPVACADNASPADKIAAQLSEEFGVKVVSYKMPAEDADAIDETVKKVTAEFGEVSSGGVGRVTGRRKRADMFVCHLKLDIVIANAGICTHEDAETMTNKQFEDVFRVNTFAPYYLARAGASPSPSPYISPPTR